MFHNLRKGNRYCSRKCSCSCRARVPSPHIDKKEMPKLPGLRKGWKFHLHKIILMHLISRLTTLLALNSNKHAYCTVRAVHVLCIRMICKYARILTCFCIFLLPQCPWLSVLAKVSKGMTSEFPNPPRVRIP